MDKIISWLFEILLTKLEEAAAKTDNKIDDAAVEAIRKVYENLKSNRA